MSTRTRLTVGLALLGLGLVVAVIQALLAVHGDAPCFSGLSLLALLAGGVGAGVALTSHDNTPPTGLEGSQQAGVGE
ncbi:hypothetical protein GZ998_05360 [Actinomyces sp. 594]|uniref:hypothetical protein n=1 Tax=Actinomyces sp. 594 TaxID=2057793 RepID=UPI001C58A904|nr:hypothetical protein [Actinomyces sp. 594]MBW3068940.1 hypothetical protein [Actinomyces sp. 594]